MVVGGCSRGSAEAILSLQIFNPSEQLCVAGYGGGGVSSAIKHGCPTAADRVLTSPCLLPHLHLSVRAGYPGLSNRLAHFLFLQGAACRHSATKSQKSGQFSLLEEVDRVSTVSTFSNTPAPSSPSLRRLCCTAQKFLDFAGAIPILCTAT